MFYDFNCDFCEDLNAISLNLLVHKQDGHEICEKLIVATVSDDQEYDHENENTAVNIELIALHCGLWQLVPYRSSPHPPVYQSLGS